MFSDFHGNADIVHRLRDMLARDHFPHAVVLAGGQGSGKIHAGNDAGADTELPELQSPMACLIFVVPAPTARASRRPLISTRDLPRRLRRGDLRETDKKETRIMIQTHPDVLVIPPDPPQMMVKVDQVRRVIETFSTVPPKARKRSTSLPTRRS